MVRKMNLFIILGVILILLIVGCTAVSNKNDKVDNPKKTEEQIAQAEKKEKEKIEKNFNALIQGNSEPYKLVKFVDENVSKATPEFAEHMVLELEKAQANYIVHYTELLFAGDRQSLLLAAFPQYEFDPNKIDNINDEELKEILNEIVNGKYKLVNSEGAFYPAIDYNSLGKYKGYLSEEMMEFFNIKKVYIDTPLATDAQVVVPWDEIGNRLKVIEEYLAKYPESIKEEEAVRFYGEYLAIYMSGTDNTPICNIEDKKILDEVLDSYEKIAKGNNDDITSKIIGEYLKLIKDNNYVIDDNVTSKVIDLNNEAIGSLEEQS